MDAATIDRAVERILERVAWQGGLELDINEALAFAETAKRKGIEKALRKHGRRYADFAAELAEECDDHGLVSGEGAEVGDLPPLDEMSDDELRAEGQRLAIRNWHTMKRETLIEALREHEYFVAAGSEETPE